MPHVFVNDVDDGAERFLSKFVSNTELGGEADTLKDHAAIQRDINRLEKWDDRNLMKFKKRKSKILHPGRNNTKHQYKLGTS